MLRSVRLWPLWAQPRLLVAYIVTVVGLAVALAAVAVVRTPLRLDDVAMFLALLACGAVCVEATRRLGAPAGVSRDLLSAWWLPIALLLPPVYALLAPLPLMVLIQLRVRRCPSHRRALTMAAVGIAGALTSTVFHRVVGEDAAVTAGWLSHPSTAVALALGCGALFTAVNSALVALAAHAVMPEASWRELLWDKENLTLDAAEVSVGVLVTAACAVTPVLLLVALPPVVLLQRSLLYAQLQAAARTDAKTGLLNPAAWQREADTEITRALRTGEPLALLIVDIDHFKQVNDRHGHLAGDQVLADMAATLRSQLREYDLVGRFGGEEFVVALPHADIDKAEHVAERLRVRIHRTATPVDEGLISVTVSIGVAMLGRDGHDLIELLAAADLALYRAKEGGRDQVRLSTTAPIEPEETVGTDD